MVERTRTVWGYRVLLIGLFALTCFVLLLPLNPGPGRIPGPDVLLLIIFAWTIMRPEYVPIWLAALLLLIADLFLMRPPGLWAALGILGAEFLNSRRQQLRESTFLMEWILVAMVVTAMTLVNAVVLSLFSVPQPSLGLGIIRLVFTALAYPLVLILAGRAWGLRRQSPAESDGLGSRS